MLNASKGKVYIIGAGPGDPGLLTVKGLEIIRRADAVVYDTLVNPLFLKETRPDIEIINAGRPATSYTMQQDGINGLLIELAQAGKVVARLKGGDAFVFGQGEEEAEALQAAGIAYEIVPGVTSAFAAPAYAGIPVSHSHMAANFSVVDASSTTPLDWQSLVRIAGTLIFLNAQSQLEQIVVELVSNGKSPSTPVAIVRWGTTWQQTTVTGTLRDIQSKAEELTSPLTVVVGEVVSLRPTLQWFDLPSVTPLLGKRVVVTRAGEQAANFVKRLTELGALAIEFPVIKITDPDSYAPMDNEIGRMEQYDWIVFTSVNGVDFFWRRLQKAGKDARSFANLRIAAIGPATADAVRVHGLEPDFVPSRFVAEAILEEIGAVAGQKFLLPRAAIARENLIEGLEKADAHVVQVSAYNTIVGGDNRPGHTDAAKLVQMLEAGEIDVVTFTSSSTVRNFAARLASVSQTPLTELLKNTTVACIGPITANTARELSLQVGLEASEFTIEGLIKAISHQPLAIS